MGAVSYEQGTHAHVCQLWRGWQAVELPAEAHSEAPLYSSQGRGEGEGRASEVATLNDEIKALKTHLFLAQQAQTPPPSSSLLCSSLELSDTQVYEPYTSLPRNRFTFLRSVCCPTHRAS